MADAIENRLIVPRVVGSYLARVAIVFAAQFAAGKLGYVFQTISNGDIGPVWPASGIALGALLLYGYSVWPGVAAGAFLLICLSPLSYRDAAIYTAGTTLAALLGAFLLRRVSRLDCALSRLRDVLALIVLGGFVSSLVSASVGTPILDAAHLHGWSEFGSAWLIYWLGDGTGVVLVTPVLLTFADLVKLRHRGRIAELVILFLLLTVTCFIVFGDLPSIPVRLVAFAVLPFVMWAAVRFGIGATALSILLIAAMATVKTESGSGPFASNTPFLNAVLLDVFFAVLAGSGLTLAAAMEERDQAERQRERLAREQAAMEVRLRLATIVESSDDAIIGADVNGVVTDWNKGAERLFGYSAPEAIGKHISFLGGADRPEEAQGILQTVIDGELVKHYETVRQRKDGTQVDVALTVSPIFDAEGRAVGASGIARDISERKRAEEKRLVLESRFRQFFETMPEYCYMISPTGEIIEANRAACLALGYTKDELMGKPVSSLYAPDSRSKMGELLRRWRSNGELRDEEMVVITKQGQRRTVLLNAGSVRGSDGNILHSASVQVDITDRKMAEEALSAMSGRLIHAQEQERARIARELHDDINQRLALVAIGLEQVQQHAPDSASELRTRIGAIQNQTTQISNDVQKMSHELHSSRLEYLGLVAAVKGLCKDFGERQKVEIDFKSHDVPSRLPPEISLCLFRVAQEALQNAAKYSGVVHFDVQLWGSAGEIHLTVSDPGKGFDTEAARNGAGLGLTSMQERLKLVKGELSIDSRRGSGTTVHARVPFSATSAARMSA